MHIIFSKATAARLARARSASITLRLIVHNSVASVTVITRATLPR